MLAGLLSLGSALPVLLMTWALRKRLSCMAAMMVAMALGMAAGLLTGLAAGVSRPSDLWWGTLVGSGAGFTAGVLAGAAVSLMAMLDGALSGLMGGMMGAMLGVMAPERAKDMLVAGTAVMFATSGILLILIAREVGGDRPWEAISRLCRHPGPRVVLMIPALALGFGLGGLADVLPADPHAAHGPAPPREITVRATEFAFSTPVIEVARGERVRLRFINLGKVNHDLNVVGMKAAVALADEAHGGGGVHAHARPGQEAVVEFVALEPGRFKAICTLPGHDRLGMQLEVAVR